MRTQANLVPRSHSVLHCGRGRSGYKIRHRQLSKGKKVRKKSFVTAGRNLGAVYN